MGFLLLAASLGFGQQATVSTPTVTLGEPFVATIAAPAVAAMTPDLEASATEYFQIAKAEPAKALTGAWDLTIVPLALGKLKLPIFWKVQSGGATKEFKSEISVEVVEPPGAGEELADIKSPRPARPAVWPWLLAVLAGALAFWLWTRFKKDAAPAALSPVVVDHRAPEVIAEEALFSLAASELWPQRRYKEYYLRLTDILRQYVERRFTMPATKLTTAELARQMRQAELDRSLIQSFRAVFDRADLVKFSKVEPEDDWGRRDLEQARELVKRTTPDDVAIPREGRL